MAPPASSSSATTSVQVALRIRPSTSQDLISIPARFQRTILHAASPTSVAVDSVTSSPSGSGAPTPAAAAAANAKKQQHFTFDQVIPPDTTQHAVFSTTAQPLLSRFLEGFNCTILAYGQTSSGKTFTMTGLDLDADPSDPTTGMGIIPRAVSTLFQRVRALKNERGATWDYTLKGSFIEIYNEDLIDLLSDDGAGGRREVQIRENKDGSIIWGGLREVAVKNTGEVMNLIRQGTSIRRTNETDMNAQSSRSHAIFSLTLTQRKYTGSGTPGRSPSPLPPNGRSPSRLARPGSMMSGPSGNRVSSPTFGRPGTPSFQSAMGRGGVRPASSLGHHLEPRAAGADDGAGDWTTVVSKFHFVDLAGSERLKRTSAAGDRIKEGISINSGLLALGNVISALGDPARAKSHTASYVPYRDSKLTRLLQDSLGGNAHTLMIACVSAAEWNAAETVNTLKYANRARNIKNRATINEKEEGWDDVEWLQNMVTRLRKDLKTFKEGGAIAHAETTADGSPPEGASKKMMADFSQLKASFEDLREKYIARNEELNRLRKEHGESHRADLTGTIPGMSKYEEIVGPVIEEYEKSISAMEAELNLNRAALRHTNELVEEKEEELAQLTERKAATELYVEELRARLAKVTEREASTEAYVRDLEEKIKQYDETNVSSSESMSDLKRELSRFKDSESHSTSYIAELEARLTKSDESILSLRQTVERLEQECERRRDEAELMQSRLENLKKDGESWRTDLEQREQRVRELELKMQEWEAKKKEAGEARERLGGMASDAAEEHRKLTADYSKTNSSAVSLVSNASSPKGDVALEDQLILLQQTHTATLADLSSVTAKYRDALREISDLAAQIQELKISAPPQTESPDRSVDLGSSHRRRKTGGRQREGSESYLTGGRRSFFRQAASTESLHSRSLSQSLSLSQELSSVRSRKTSLSSHGSSPTSSPSHRPNLSISLPALQVSPHERSATSLEKEIMRLQDVLKEREQEIAHLEQSLKEKESNTSVTASSSRTFGSDGSASPVEGDSSLSPGTLHRFEQLKSTMMNGHRRTESLATSETDESLERLNELMMAMAQKESQHRETVEGLNDELAQLRRQRDELAALSSNQTLNMSKEFESLRVRHEDAVARLEDVEQRETQLKTALEQARADHTSTVEQHTIFVEQLRAQHEETLRIKEEEVGELIARLKEEHEHGLANVRNQLSEEFVAAESSRAEHDAALANAHAQLAEASAALEKSHADHSEAFGKLKAEHEAELRTRLDEASALLSKVRQEHDIAVKEMTSKYEAALKAKDDDIAATLAKTEEEYYNGLTKLRIEHAEALEREAVQAAATVARLREEHAAELRVAEITREGSLSESQSAQALTIQHLQDEHATAIARKEAAFAEDLERVKAEHARLLASAAEEHAAAMERSRSEHAAALSQAQDASGAEIESLLAAAVKAQEDFDVSSAKARQEADAALQAVKEQQAVILQDVAAGHQEDLAKLGAEHQAALDAALAKVEQERASLVEAHNAELTKLRAEHEQALAEVRDSSRESVIEEASKERSFLVQSHSEQLLAAKTEHESALEAALARAEEERTLLVQRHTQLTAAARAEHETAMAELSATLVAEQSEHRRALEAARTQSEQAFAAEKEHLKTVIADLEAKHAKERETLRKDHDLLSRELSHYKAVAEEHGLALQEARAGHEEILNRNSETITNLHQDLSEAHNEREELAHQVAALQAELNTTQGKQTKLVQEASKRDSLVEELEKHRSVLAETQRTLQRIRDEKDAIQEEKLRQEIAVRDLQAQLARVPSPTHDVPSPTRPPNERTLSSLSRMNGHVSAKLPPPTPPPSVPPPPAPKAASEHHTFSSISSGTPISATSSRESEMDSPATSVTPSVANGHFAIDPKLVQQVEDQSKTIEEQETMIKTLNKQLTHCESDLQAHMDLVTTLETSLGESEKNLRKARMHATELARERDTLNSQIDGLRHELQDAKREVVSVRRSVVEEKQSLESRLDEERRAKEKARQQLDSRMDELQRRKSKFVCL